MEVPRDRLDLRDDPQVVSPPSLTQPYACASAANVTGYILDAKLDIEVAGAIVVNGAPGGSPFPFGATIPLPNPLVSGQSVRARQHHAGAALGQAGNLLGMRRLAGAAELFQGSGLLRC